MRGLLVPALLLACGSLAVATCGSPTEASSPLTGAWQTAPIPSGGGIDLSLTAAGPIVTGAGYEYGLEHVLADSLTVTGRQGAYDTFRLTLTFGSGAIATYTGKVVGSELHGTWTVDQSSYPLTFYRQP